MLFRSLHVDLLADGDPVLRVTLPLSISPVEDFYRWVNLREAGGKISGRQTDISIPSAFPDGESDGNDVLFVHGYRVDAEGARGWHAEMFKRFWQSGCNSRYWAFTWRGNDGIVKNGGLNYQANVVHAFETAPAFAAFVADCNALLGETTVLAHSLGNMVVCSAIQDHGFLPDRYFMLNAAVPAEALDVSTWSIAETNNPFEFEDWVGYPSASWASRWHELFPTNDMRNQLTWKNRFADVPQRTELYNWYSSGDEVLAVFDTPDADGSGKITIKPFGVGGSRIHSWQKQERFKGRWGQSILGGWAGTSEMGWGFSSQGYYEDGTPPLYQMVVDPANLQNYVIVRTFPYGTNDAANASSDQLRIDPVFNHDPPKILSGNLLRQDVDELLARGVPALSGPVGSMAIPSVNSAVNENLNGFSTVSGWPRTNEPTFSGWRHSDIKNIALPFVFPAFHQLVQSFGVVP